MTYVISKSLLLFYLLPTLLKAQDFAFSFLGAVFWAIMPFRCWHVLDPETNSR